MRQIVCAYRKAWLSDAQKDFFHMFLGGLCIFPCLPPWGKVSRSDGRGALAFLLCHPELVVTRLCCQHFAYWQNARLARRLLLFPKISLRCDFREPCFSVQSIRLFLSFRPRRAESPPSGEILRSAYRETNSFAVFFPAFTFYTRSLD